MIEPVALYDLVRKTKYFTNEKKNTEMFKFVFIFVISVSMSLNGRFNLYTQNRFMPTNKMFQNIVANVTLRRETLKVISFFNSSL